MNSIIIALFCLVLLVIQREIEAINCYTCLPGTDGCGPSFSKTGAGVLPSTNSSYTNCIKDVCSSNMNAIARSGDAACAEGSNTVFGITYYRYCCATDLCNGASTGKANLIFAPMSLLIVLILIN